MMTTITKKGMFWSILLLFTGFSTVYAQSVEVSIGKMEVEGVDVLLDFKQDDNRGIILPWVISQNDVPAVVGGTLIFDADDKRVKYYRDGVNPGWVDMSINEGDVDLTIQDGLTESGEPAVIGDVTTSVSGVLVLESSDKAMVLPKMDSPHLNILSPAPGTIAYDKVSKMLCVFNGEEWAFWKVQD